MMGHPGAGCFNEDLTIAPWNYCSSSTRTFNDVLLFESLSSASRLSREWKLKGSFSISRAVLQKAHGKESLGPDEMITLKGWMLEAFPSILLHTRWITPPGIKGLLAAGDMIHQFFMLSTAISAVVLMVCSSLRRERFMAFWAWGLAVFFSLLFLFFGLWW
ncbi:MAG: hypothetical protein RDV48_26235 [Candidatus Eremiobacteraeota bacterium]|nr:hypothetical protein [Candidatus Eremiobacteraeota bacterium]